jgi:heme/copper-type cytochrome/quinol oxidase subunit 2
MTQNARMKQEKRLFTTMFLVSFVTIITMVPLAIYVILQGRTNNINSDPVHMLFSTLLFVNFSINPFVYLWRLKNYRKTFKIVFKNMGGCCLRKTFEPSQEQRRI